MWGQGHRWSGWAWARRRWTVQGMAGKGPSAVRSWLKKSHRNSTTYCRRVTVSDTKSAREWELDAFWGARLSHQRSTASASKALETQTTPNACGHTWEAGQSSSLKPYGWWIPTRGQCLAQVDQVFVTDCGSHVNSQQSENVQANR